MRVEVARVDYKKKEERRSKVEERWQYKGLYLEGLVLSQQALHKCSQRPLRSMEY